MERKLNLTRGHEAAKWYQNPKKERKSYEKTTCCNNKLLCTAAAVPDPLTAQQEPAEPRAQLANTSELQFGVFSTMLRLDNDALNIILPLILDLLF